MQNLSGGNVWCRLDHGMGGQRLKKCLGIGNDDYGQSKYPYTTRIIMRYERERPTRPNDTIDYDGTAAV